MSVVLEFTIGADQFHLGESLSGIQDTIFELERVVPTGNHVIPFIWLTTDADLNTVLDAFERKLLDRPAITDVRALDRIENGALYRITWRVPDEDIIDGLVQTDATILEARSQNGEQWQFRVRFSNHNLLAQFQNILTENDVTIHIDRIYTFTAETDRRHQFGLSSEQREALVLALRRGYFDSPREVSLDELAAALDITKQAVSDRIRRGNKKVLETTLLSSAVDG